MKRILTVLLLVALCFSAKAFDVRAVYVDHRTQVQTLPALKALARKAADGGMNALVMEWEATVPFEVNATLCNRYAFSREEAQEFISYCSNLGIEVIPLQNCFGHCEYILRHDRYSSLREDKKDFSQVCPSKIERATDVFRSIFAEIAALHPSDYIHIGCDETRLLGHCKRCRSFVDEHGESELFVNYVSAMCSIVKELGKTPVIWADILLQHPEAADVLPKDVVVVDWNYGWKAGHFGGIDALLAKGFTMWGASALRSSPDNIYLTDWSKHFNNLREYIPFCREKGFKGVVQTSWSTSGQYGYIWDHNSLVELQPIREVYPAQAFDILWQAFFEAVRSDNLLPASFEKEYLREHFAISEDKAERLAAFLGIRQRPVTGSNFTMEAIVKEIAATDDAVSCLKDIRPRGNRRDYAHLVLMADIRRNYLGFKRLEWVFENATENHAAIAAELKPLVREARRLERRFIRLNRKNLKDPSIPLGQHSYVARMKDIYEICK